MIHPAPALNRTTGADSAHGKRWLVALSFVAVALIAFSPALDAPFDFDDGPTVIGNTTIRSAWPPTALVHTPPIGAPVSGRPVANYSFALDFALNRLFGFQSATWAASTNQTVVYHVTNVLLHVGVALLLFALIELTVRDGNLGEEWKSFGPTLAACVAMLWLIHPLQTDAVDYVSQRTEVLVSMFYVATLYAAARAWRDAESESSLATHWQWSALAVLACALGMASKEVMITAPLAVMLYDRAFVAANWRGPWANRRRRWTYLALLSTCAISIGLTLGGARGGTAGFGTGMPWFTYLRSQGWAIPHYLRLAFWPAGLTIDYGQRPFSGGATLIGLVLLSVLGALTIAAWTKAPLRWLAFLGSMFFLWLAPSSSIVPINTEIAAERRVYLALAPVLIAVIVGVEWLARRRSALAVRRSKAAAFVAVVLTLAVVTYRRSAEYHDPAALWAEATRAVPTNARAFDNLAAADIRGERPALARDDSLLAHALALDSTFISSWTRRAGIAISEARFADAVRYLHRTLALKPDEWNAMGQLGRAFIGLNALDSAIVVLRVVVERAPSAGAYADLGAAYLSAAQFDSAAATLTRAVRIDPTNVSTLGDLGAALVERGRGADAISYLERATELDPRSGFNLGLLSVALAQAGRTADATQTARAAVNAASGDVPALVFAGRAMLTTQQPRAAAEYLTEATRRSPGDPQPATWLAIAMAGVGDSANARTLLRRILVTVPEYEPARAYFARLGGR